MLCSTTGCAPPYVLSECSKSTGEVVQFGCGNIKPCGGTSNPVRCALQCRVQKVVVSRKNQSAPVLGWLTGHEEFLYVEILAASAGSQLQRTSSGVRLTNDGRFPNCGSQEVWIWGDVDAKGKCTGELLSLKVYAHTELSLRVLGRHQDWSNTIVPLETAGEARFRIDEDVLPAMLGDGAFSLPLLLEGRIRGMVTLTAWANAEDKVAAPMPRLGTPDDQLPIRGKTDRLVRLKGHILAVTCCAIFPCGTRMLTGSKDAVGIIWSTTGEQIAWLHGHSEGIISCAVFKSGSQVVTISEDEIGIIWSSAGKQLATLNAVGICVPFPTSDQLLAAVGTDGAAIFASSGAKLTSLKGHADRVTACAVFPSEKMVITGSKDEEAIIWSNAGDNLRVLRGHSDCITACAVFPSGDRVMTASRDKTAIIWSSSGEGKQFGQQLSVLRGHRAGISSAVVFRDGQCVLTVSEDKTGIIWSTDGTRLHDLRGHIGGLTGCASFLSDDRLLTISTDKLAAVWQHDGVRLAELHGHSEALRSCAVFPSGQHVLTTSDDMTGIVWPLAMFIEPPVRFRRV